jgi:hypothetical protein
MFASPFNRTYRQKNLNIDAKEGGEPNFKIRNGCRGWGNIGPFSGGYIVKPKFILPLNPNGYGKSCDIIQNGPRGANGPFIAIASPNQRARSHV